MKKFIAPAFIAAIALAFGLAQNATAATSGAKPMTAQQSKFATCAHKSKGMKGAAHKKFMHDCLKGKSTDKPEKPEAKHQKSGKGGSR
jgi:psiF repeat